MVFGRGKKINLSFVKDAGACNIGFNYVSFSSLSSASSFFLLISRETVVLREIKLVLCVKLVFLLLIPDSLLVFFFSFVYSLFLDYATPGGVVCYQFSMHNTYLQRPT